MSARRNPDSLGRNNPPSSSQPSSSKLKGTIVPHPVNPTPAVDLVNRYQILGQIPKPFSTVLASKPSAKDPFDICTANPQPSQPGIRIYQSQQSKSEYVPSHEINLFYVEPSMSPKNDPVKLANQFFPPGWHFIPFAPYKSLAYYKNILIQTESITIKPIFDRKDESKILYHSLYIKQIISQSEWHNHPSDLQSLDNHGINFCYYDYIEAWHKVFLYQNQLFSHSWFIQFDHKFKSPIPFWFTIWWTKYGPNNSILPELLQAQINHFKTHSKPNPKFEGIPILLQFISKYKIPWILKWQYNLKTQSETVSQISGKAQASVTIHSQTPFVSRIFFIKWWDKFDVNRIVGQVQKEFPLNPIQIPPSQAKDKKPLNSSSSINLSSVKEYSESELKLLLQAINSRYDSLQKEASNSDQGSKASDTASDAQSETSPNSDPYSSQLFQDSQDPYAL